MEASGFGLDRIGQVHINAGDLERAVAFYRDVLGMRYLFEVPRMAFFDCGGVRLMLGLAESEEYDHAASVIYYDVPDLVAAYEALKGRGAEFMSDPHKVADLGERELWMAFLRDSESNVLALMSEIAKPAE